MLTRNRIVGLAGVLGVIGLGVIAAPAPAQAWWVGGGGVRFGVVLPPVVVAPPPVYYAPPPAYYAPPPAYYTPRPYWVRGHWSRGYWVPGHWA